MLKLQAKQKISSGISLIFGFAARAVLLAGGFIVAGQVFLWLKTGNWPPFPIRKMLRHTLGIIIPPSESKWVGFNQVIDWIVNIHGAVLVVLIAGIFGIFAAFGESKLREIEREIANVKREKEDMVTIQAYKDFAATED